LRRERLTLFMWDHVIEQLRVDESPLPRHETRPSRAEVPVSPEALALAEELSS